MCCKVSKSEYIHIKNRAGAWHSSLIAALQKLIQNIQIYKHYSDSPEQLRDSSVLDALVSRRPEFGCWLSLQTRKPPLRQLNSSLSPFPIIQVLLSLQHSVIPGWASTAPSLHSPPSLTLGCTTREHSPTRRRLSVQE